MAKILYLGNSNRNSTCFHRASALERIGHEIILRDPYLIVETDKTRWFTRPLNFRTGYVYVQFLLNKWLKKTMSGLEGIDLIWIDSGEFLGPTGLILLRRLRCPILLYNVDDPTGKRDGQKFRLLLKALPLYDLVAVVRPESKTECEALGARRVIQVYRSYDEVAHKPFDDINDIPQKFRSEVAFIGTWMRHEKRDEFLLTLKKSNVQFSIWGDRWQKSKYWAMLQSHHKGPALGGRDYVGAMQGSKICIGLLSKGNRDLHTQRSLEVPFAGGLLLAERTADHIALYEEGKEAFFWKDAGECAQECLKLLSHDSLREGVRGAGMLKIRKLGLGNEDIMRYLLSEMGIKN